MSTTETARPIELAIADGIAHLSLNRPTQANSLDLEAAQALVDAVRSIEDADVRAVVLTGAGARFCAGGDVASFVAAADRSAHLRLLADTLDAAMQHLAALPVVVVAGVQGAVAGAGLSVMLAADVIVAERGTRFVTAYAGIGLTPDIGLSWLLPRAVGQVRALDLLLTGRVLDADTALSWGLITEVVDGEAAERARELAARIAGSAPQALGQARRLVRDGWESTRAEAGAAEARAIARAVTTEEATPLIEAFVAR